MRRTVSTLAGDGVSQYVGLAKRTVPLLSATDENRCSHMRLRSSGGKERRGEVGCRSCVFDMLAGWRSSGGTTPGSS